MKRITMFLLTLSCLTNIIIKDVRADSASTIITLYDIIVTNPNGAKATNNYGAEKKEVLFDYGTKLTVIGSFESTQSFDKYSLFIKYEGDVYEVSASDVAVLSQNYEMSNATKLNEVQEALTLDDVIIYKGPSSLFDKIGEIPKYTEVNYQYVINTDNNDLDSIGNGYSVGWIYIEYNGIAGWVLKDSGYRTIFIGDADTRYVKSSSESPCGVSNIPDGTILKCDYQSSGVYGRACIVKYNGEYVEMPWLCSYSNTPDFSEEKNISINETNDQTIVGDVITVGEDSTSQNKKDYYNIIFISIGIAGAIAFGAGITLIVINKKKK